MKYFLTFGLLLLLVTPTFGQLDMAMPGPNGVPISAADRDNNRAYAALKAVHDKPVFDLLEWTPEQKAKIKSAIKKVDDLNGQIARNPRDKTLTAKRYELLRSLRDELMDFQITELRGLRRSSVIEVVLHSDLAARHLELTDAQKKRIQSRSNKIGKEIREFLEKKRVEAAQVMQEELGMEQQELLIDLVGVDALNRTFQSTTAGHLGWELSIGDSERGNKQTFGQSTKEFWK